MTPFYEKKVSAEMWLIHTNLFIEFDYLKEKTMDTDEN